MNSAQERILIIDFGSQYTQLIARRIRESNVYCEIFAYDVDTNAIKAFNPKGIILSGGPETTTEINTPRAPQIVFELGCPVFGICYGMQTMAVQLGGKVAAHAHREFGYAEIEITDINPLLYSLASAKKTEINKFSLDVWMSHGDQVTELPPNFKVIAKTLSTPIAAMADEQRKFYGVQFHPEVTHTAQGLEIIRHFLFTICACKPEWTPRHILEAELKEIKQKVGDDQVILGLSGGVDSAVVAALLHQVIGDKLICVFVDHGLLRQNEAEQVMLHMQTVLQINIIHIDASQRFLSALKGITDPEQKRKIIGKLFIDEFEAVAQQYPNVKWLGQGTIYTDVIESAHANASNKAHKIKSHHNVGGLPERMKLKLLEPLYYLFKDEVRNLGLELGLPADLINRHPFPGPGLAVRIIGEITEEYLQILKQADAIFIEELHNHHLYHAVNQAFAVFLPIKSVGVVGDARQYAYVISLRAVVTTDFMTAHWAQLSYSLLEKASTRICNEVKNVSRVVYDITSKPPATIEWE